MEVRRALLCTFSSCSLISTVVCSIAGINVKTDIEALKTEVPNIVVGTPGRVMDLATTRKALDLSHVKHFVLDECDRMLAELSMRKDVQTIFKATPHEKQVMMFSATLDKDVRAICRKFCQDVSWKFLLVVWSMFMLRCMLSRARFSWTTIRS